MSATGKTQQMEGLVAWITGGGSGLGRALALEMARRGAIVAVSGRRLERLEETVTLVRELGGDGLIAPCDVTDEAGVEAALRSVVEARGRLDLAVAGAGYGAVGAFERLEAAVWRRQFEVNVVGVVITLRAALPELRKTRGRAAVISSVAGKIALAGSAPYSASKYALVGLCNALYQELAGTGVSLTNLLPGYVESEIAQVDSHGVHHPDWQDRRARRFMWPAERAARVMVDAIWARRREHTFTAYGRAGAFAGQFLPGLVYPLLARQRAQQRARKAEGSEG
jgi:NAD(P)-dependent dehydrogenase (short-subunit alcohol dehydrogenase family)